MAQQDSQGHPGWPCRSLRSPWAGSTDVTPPAQGEGPQKEKEERGGTWQASPPWQALSQAVGAAGAGWLGPEELAGLSDGHQVPADEDVKAKSGSGLQWKCSMGVCPEGAARYSRRLGHGQGSVTGDALHWIKLLPAAQGQLLSTPPAPRGLREVPWVAGTTWAG